MTLKIVATDNNIEVGKFEICDDFKFGILSNLNAWHNDKENKSKIKQTKVTSRQEDSKK